MRRRKKHAKKPVIFGGLVITTVLAGCFFLKSYILKTENQIISDKQSNQEGSVVPDEQIAEERGVQLTEFVAYQNPEMYTYENLESDTQLLLEAYGDLVKADSVGTTADGRSIYHFVAGNPEAEHKLFINGGIHAREYMTCQLVMKQLITYLEKVKLHDSYKNVDYTAFWDTCAVHVIPMINPDGVSISQYGITAIRNQDVRANLEQIAQREGGAEDAYYFTRWKSNGNGVDLNRNFDALWEQYDDHVGQPSADHYKGISVGCETESAALIQLTEQEMFDAVLCYHTQGSVIYWYFGQEGQLYTDTKMIADIVSAATGYPTDANFEYLDPAGYKDWCIDKMGIPGLTIEIGEGTSPVPYEQFDDIWCRNQYVWENIILWAINK